MLTSETKRRIDACRDILVGKLPLPTDQVELITLALIYKFMDDLDEESVKLGGRRSFFTGPLAAYRWRALLPQTVSGDERMALFARGIELLGGAELEIEEKGQKRRTVPAAHLPGLFRDIFRNAFLKFRDGRILTLFLTEINGFAYSHSEELGNAFEYALQCMGTQGENGQFRTPRHIIDFIVACLEPRPEDRILDPACGTGGFLVSAYKRILKSHTSPGSEIPGDLLTHARRQKLYANLTGYDITDLMVKLTKVNLFLHGFPDPAVHIYDTLSNDARWPEKADLILANPPFMTPKGGVTPHTRFRIAAKKAEVLFTDYIAEHLAPEGRAGVIVPNGIVATTQNAYVKLRRFLVEDSLVAVVSLPAGVFKPYSGVKTSVLLLDKALARRTKEVLFLKIAADGFDLGDKRNPVEADDLPEAERIVKLWLAGTLDDSVETPLAWKAVDKKALLENRSVNLQCEPFLGNGAASTDAETVRLGEVAEVAAGNSAPQGDHYFADGRYPFFRTADVGRVKVSVNLVEPADRINEHCLTSHRLRQFPIGTILFPKSGASTFLNHRAMLGVAGYVSSHLACIIADEKKALPHFLFWLLTTVDARTLSDNDGYPSLRLDQIADLEIPLPPLDEQRRIVEEIEGYQKVIDGARQILAGFVPRFEVIPSWPRQQLRDVVRITSGGTPPKDNPNYWTGTIPWISAKDMKAPRLSDAQLHVSDAAISKTATNLAPKGTVLILVRGMGLANGVPVCELLSPCAFNQDIKALLPNKAVNAAFLAAAIRQETTQLSAAIGTAAHGTLKIETEQLLNIHIPLPPLDEQRRIVAELDAEAAQMDVVRALIPRFEAKIQRVLDRVWGAGRTAEQVDKVDRVDLVDRVDELDKVAEASGAVYRAAREARP